jgi:hypothetical protein
MSNANIINGITKLKQAKDLLEDAMRTAGKESVGAKLIGNVVNRIEGAKNVFVTSIWFPDVVREGIRKEWASDSFTVDAITEKIALLSPKQRDTIEAVLDKILAGELLQVEYIDNQVNSQ